MKYYVLWIATLCLALSAGFASAAYTTPESTTAAECSGFADVFCEHKHCHFFNGQWQCSTTYCYAYVRVLGSPHVTDCIHG